MPISNSSNIGYLDIVRHNSGVDKLKIFFHTLVKNNAGNAITLINDKSLHFASLFVLKPEIEGLNLSVHLNSRNQYALAVINGILAGDHSTIGRLSSSRNQMMHSTLKWMFGTGCINDGLSNQFDEVLDTAAILLIKKFKDKTDIHIIVEMIFNRHKKGLLIHDLVWAFFEAHDPQSLILVANRLCSNDSKDVELARKLLKFIPCIGMNNKDNIEQHSCAVHWIKENHMFMFHTGEGFHQRSDPKPYALSLEAKYLCKASPAHDEKAFRSFTQNEHSLLNKFRGLDTDTKTLLSDYSFWLYRQNPYLWDTWLRYPVDEQIRTAKTMLGGLP